MKTQKGLTKGIHLSFIRKNSGLYATLIIILIGLLGCAGWKGASRSHPNYGYLKGGYIPANKSVSIRTFNPQPKSDQPAIIRDTSKEDKSAAILEDDKKVHNLFIETFRKELESSKLFKNISVIPYNEKANTDLVFELKTDSGWVRPVPGHPSKIYLSVEGNLLDVTQNKAIFEFELMRSSMGGALGAGGLLTAGTETMRNKLSKWLSEDLVENIKDRITANYQGK
jgi:hypothetical protein